jgi:hypothetical protein
MFTSSDMTQATHRPTKSAWRKSEKASGKVYFEVPFDAETAVSKQRRAAHTWQLTKFPATGI